jgi:hypothetical protein
MADIPLNSFKTITAVLTQSLTDIYTAPANVTAIVLMAQIANIDQDPVTATFIHNSGFVNTELIRDYLVPGNDAASAIVGKLILQTGQKIRASAGVNNQLKLTLSILESANE